MAQLYIQNGVDVNANWTASIAVSPDGVHWSSLPKTDMAVHQLTLFRKQNALNDSAIKRVVSLRYKGTQDFAIKFKLSDVADQPTWTDNDAGLIQAQDDISDWIEN